MSLIAETFQRCYLDDDRTENYFSNLINENGQISDLDKALKADSGASIFGTFFGCSPVTSYVESSAGVEAGGRTGLTAIFVGILFLFSMFLSPLASIIPPYATAGALIYVAILMLGGMEKLNWSNATELLPALVIIVMIPLTFSIADGIALGFLTTVFSCSIYAIDIPMVRQIITNYFKIILDY